MSTPNMGLALPVDHGSADAWDTILDAVFGLVDAHDHTAGKGVLVPMAALNVNADLLFSAAGVSRAITSLRAIDFSPQPAAGMTALAGAFFLSDGSSGLSANELYYRTTAGVNVKFTSGSALNVAGFAGGIGGDYAAAGALVVFDDATDAYWFQQQLGASVRQYARMRSADLDLFEYKAQPAAGVPTNRVRLASPTALAASYALTFPAALPAAKSVLVVDAAGNVTSQGGNYTYQAGLGQPNGIGVPTFDGIKWALGAGTTITCPIILPVGSTFASWKIYVFKGSGAGGTLTTTLQEENMLTGATVQIGATQSTAAAAPGFLQFSGVGTTIVADRSYYLAFSCTGASGDFLYGWAVQI